MSALRPPILGPIVGHTTPTSCRLWMRSGDPADQGSHLSEDRRTIGVLTVLDERGRPVPGDPKRSAYFRLHREYDRTGTFNLGRQAGLDAQGQKNVFVLQPDTAYRVKMGSLMLDDAYPNDQSVSDAELARKLPPASVWAEDLADLPPDVAEAKFRTFPVRQERFSFLLGSCHYPGLFWKKKHSDRIFGPMLDRAQRRRMGKKPQFVLMVGDQIYADMLNKNIPVGLADTFEEFQDRYFGAFGSRNMRRLLQNMPQYMILDDHEIEDNWTQDAINSDRQKRILFNLAVGAYMSYQWSHGPRSFDGRLYYQFNCGDFPFFVLDQRTQRFKDDEPGLADNHMLGRPPQDPDREPGQLNHLLNWLTEHSKDPRPKFIVSPTVFVPNPVLTTRSDRHKEKSDSWPAFPETRRALLRHIVAHQIQNVVFLSGDIHCSNVARISFSGPPGVRALKAFSITSSAFYWPFWFADGEPSHYVHDSKKEGDTFEIDVARGIQMNYRAGSFTQKDNFCQIDVDWPRRRIGVRAFGQKGELIVSSTLNLA